MHNNRHKLDQSSGLVNLSNYMIYCKNKKLNLLAEVQLQNITAKFINDCDLLRHHRLHLLRRRLRRLRRP